MSKERLSDWLCEECNKKLSWGERIVLISGGEMNMQEEGPSTDKEPWWGIYHEECYGKRFYGE